MQEMGLCRPMGPALLPHDERHSQSVGQILAVCRCQLNAKRVDLQPLYLLQAFLNSRAMPLLAHAQLHVSTSSRIFRLGALVANIKVMSLAVRKTVHRQHEAHGCYPGKFVKGIPHEAPHAGLVWRIVQRRLHCRLQKAAEQEALLEEYFEERGKGPVEVVLLLRLRTRNAKLCLRVHSLTKIWHQVTPRYRACLGGGKMHFQERNHEGTVKPGSKGVSWTKTVPCC